jgi:hypothetical protein
MLYEKFILILCYLELHLWFILDLGIVFIHYHKIGSVGKCVACPIIQQGVQLMD